MKNFGSKKILGILAVVVILIALPVIIFQMQKPQDIRQRAAGLIIPGTGDTKIYLSPDTGYRVAESTEFDVQLKINTKDKLVANLTVEIIYDSHHFTYNSLKKNDAKFDSVIANPNIATDHIRILAEADPTAPVAGDVVVATLTFTSTNESGDSTIAFAESPLNVVGKTAEGEIRALTAEAPDVSYTIGDATSPTTSPSPISSTCTSGTSYCKQGGAGAQCIQMPVGNCSTCIYGMTACQPENRAAPTIIDPTSTASASWASLGGNITSQGGSSITKWGVCVGTSEDALLKTLTDPDKIDNAHHCFYNTSNITGVFQIEATGLTANTIYHFRAFAKNNTDIGYTNDAKFTTSGPINEACTLKSQGDANCDGKINTDDFNIWRDEFLNSNNCTAPTGTICIAPPRSANFNGDGAVNTDDFNIWRNGFLNASLPH